MVLFWARTTRLASGVRQKILFSLLELGLDLFELSAQRLLRQLRNFDSGIAVLVDSGRMLLAVPIGLVLIDRLVITREERYLERKFGDEYLNYKRRVRRWL